MTRISFKVLITALLIAFAAQGMAFAADKPIDQVKATVKKMVKDAKASQSLTSVEEFKKVMEGDTEFFELLDVRTAGEFKAGHLKNAMNIARGVLEFAGPKKLKDVNAKIYVYCKGGSRGALATQTLMAMGYKNVVHIEKGYKGWVEAGYPVYNDYGEYVMPPKGWGKKEE
jgi:rhodanese-related sulfurtransferase